MKIPMKTLATAGLLAAGMSACRKQAPVADSQTVTVAKNGQAEITLTATNPDGETLSYTITALPLNGTLSESGTELDSIPHALQGSTVTYAPDEDYTGSDSFTFTASNEDLTSDEATVSITVSEDSASGETISEDTTV